MISFVVTLQQMPPVPIHSTVFDFFRDKKWGTSDWTTDKNLIIYACLHNHPAKFEQLLPTTVWTPFELMIAVISSDNHNQYLLIWNMILSLLTPEDTIKTIIDPVTNSEHTLLSFLCYNARQHQPKKYDTITIYQKFESLLDVGCKWNTPVANNYSPLMWFLWSNECLDLLKWCIEHGANPHEGHLLCYSSSYINKEIQLQKTEARQMSEKYPELSEPIRLLRYRPLQNNLILDYLISLGLDVDDTLDNGRTPLLSACSEGNVKKVRALLEAGSSIYSKMVDDGMDVWFCAEQHYTYTMSFPQVKEYPMRELLQQYEVKQKKYWTEMLVEVMDGSFMVQEVLTVLTKV